MIGGFMLAICVVSAGEVIGKTLPDALVPEYGVVRDLLNL